MSRPAEQPALDLDWTLGDRLRKIRRVLGISQAEFAKRLSENPKSYASWESDHSAPRNVVAVAKRIEVMVGIPAAWVLGVDLPNLATEVETRRYRGASSAGNSLLSLVRDSDPDDLDVSPGYPSSAPESAYAAPSGGTDTAEGMHCADAA